MLIGCIGNTDIQLKKRVLINEKRLLYKKGDCLLFPIDSNSCGMAIVFDSQKDEEGLWYSVLYTNYHSSTLKQKPKLKNLKLFGREISSSLNEKGTELLFDGDYVSDSLIKNKKIFKYIGTILFNEKFTELGSYGASKDFHKFLFSFHNAKVQRGSHKKVDKVIKLVLPNNSEGYYPLLDFIK